MKRRNLALDVFDTTLVLPTLPHVDLGGAIATPHLRPEKVLFVGEELVSAAIAPHLLVVVKDQYRAFRSYPLVHNSSQERGGFIAAHALSHAEPTKRVDTNKVNLVFSYEPIYIFEGVTVREDLAANVRFWNHYEGEFRGKILSPTHLEHMFGHVVRNQQAPRLLSWKAEVIFSCLYGIHDAPGESAFANARGTVDDDLCSCRDHRRPQKFSRRKVVSNRRPFFSKD